MVLWQGKSKICWFCSNDQLSLNFIVQVEPEIDKRPRNGHNVAMTSHLPPPTLITTPNQLQLMVADLARAGRFALDTESNSMYAYHYQICLIQISTDERDYIIDTLALRQLQPLADLVQRDEVEVTMHAAENDILLLNKDFGWEFARVFDTLWGARILGWQRPGLASILKEHFGVQLDKKMQRTDWGRRPLTPRQLSYARMDTHFLLPLRDLIERDLRAAGRWEEAQEVFAELTKIRWQEKEAPSFWRISGARDLEPQQQAVLKALFQWREQRASQRNLPPYRILRNEALLDLAQTMPQSKSELLQMRSIPRRFPSHLAQNLVRIIHQAQKAPRPVFPHRRSEGQRPDKAITSRYEALRKWRTAKAAARSVEPDVVMTNHMLMAIAQANPSSMKELQELGILGPWRLQEYGQEILEVLGKEKAS